MSKEGPAPASVARRGGSIRAITGNINSDKE